MGCLYQITFPDNRSYLGITNRTAERRFRGHVADAKRYVRISLSRAIHKHGEHAATVRTLVIADDWEYLQDLERKAIRIFGTRAPAGLNNTDGGDGASPGSAWHRGFKHSDETKRKMSMAREGKIKHTTEAKAKIGAASKGNKRNVGRLASDETRRKMARSQTGISKGASSGRVGVSIRKNGRYRAHATVGGRMLSLGEHKTIELAIQARLNWETQSAEERGCQHGCQATS